MLDLSKASRRYFLSSTGKVLGYGAAALALASISLGTGYVQWPRVEAALDGDFLTAKKRSCLERVETILCCSDFGLLGRLEFDVFCRKTKKISLGRNFGFTR